MSINKKHDVEVAEKSLNGIYYLDNQNLSKFRQFLIAHTCSTITCQYQSIAAQSIAATVHALGVRWDCYFLASTSDSIN